MSRNWRERLIADTPGLQTSYKNVKTWEQRTEEETARLEFLRKKQQPDADWSRNWEFAHLWTDKELGIKVNPSDAFEAGRVSTMGEEELQDIAIHMEKVFEKGTIDTDRHYWDGAQVKACLRSGKLLNYNLRARIKPQTNWTHIQAWIAQEELPELDQTFLDAVNEVYNEGYAESLAEIRAGDVAVQGDQARLQRQRRACELVATILRAWEAQA